MSTGLEQRLQVFVDLAMVNGSANITALAAKGLSMD
jgi:hypothetical protein